MAASPLLQFLSEAQRYALEGTTLPGRPEEPPVIVMGNSAADLDSFVSSVVYASLASNISLGGRSYIPILNVPATRSKDLWRLRPEFGTALRLSLLNFSKSSSNGDARDSEATEKDLKESEKKVLGSVVTIADIVDSKTSPLRTAFQERADTSGEGVLNSASVTATSGTAPSPNPFDIVLVDHNVLSDSFAERLNVVGCIDHHIDESKAPEDIDPRIIETECGSCASLVIDYFLKKHEILRNTSQYYPDYKTKGLIYELAKLAISAIVIDTANLTSKSKTRDYDIHAVNTLTRVIENSLQKQAEPWNRDTFYKQINDAKLGTPDNLTLKEILDLDFKSWDEPTDAGKVTLGVASVIRSLDWLTSRTGGESKDSEQEYGSALRTALNEFANENAIDLLVIMTAFTGSESGSFEREILLYTPSPDGIATQCKEIFESEAKEALDLKPWEEPQATGRTPEKVERDWFKAYRQLDTSQSRKQVAPLLRKILQQRGEVL